MGEYFTYNGEQLCKIGTCEHIMYARHNEVAVLAGYDTGDMCKGALDYDGSIYRFPWPNEDYPDTPSMTGLAGIINAREAFTTQLLRVDKGFSNDLAHDRMCISVQPRNYHGYNTNVLLPCPMSTQWNKLNEQVHTSGDGFTPCINIIGEHHTKAGEIWTVFKCAYCGVWFSCNAEDIEMIKNHGANKDKGILLERLHHKPNMLNE